MAKAKSEVLQDITLACGGKNFFDALPLPGKVDSPPIHHPKYCVGLSHLRWIYGEGLPSEVSTTLSYGDSPSHNGSATLDGQHRHALANYSHTRHVLTPSS